jgi:hypothetical protein
MLKKLGMLLGVLLIPTMLFAESDVAVSGIMGSSSNDHSYFAVRLVELDIKSHYTDTITGEATASFFGEDSFELEEANLIIVDPFATIAGIENDILDGFTLKAGRQRLDFGIVNNQRAIELNTVGRPLAARYALGTTGVRADGGHVEFDFSAPMLPIDFSAGIGSYDTHTLQGGNENNSSSSEGSLHSVHLSTDFALLGANHQVGISALLNNFGADDDTDESSVLGLDVRAERNLFGYDISAQGEVFASTYHDSSDAVVTMTGGYGTLLANVCEGLSVGTRLDFQSATEGNSDIGSSIKRVNLILSKRPTAYNEATLQYVMQEDQDATLLAQMKFGLVSN